MFETFTNLFRRFPARMIIAEVRQGKPYIIEDRGTRIKEKDGSEAYLLKKGKVKIRPPPFSCMMQGHKGKTYIFLLSPEKGHYHPLMLNDPADLKVSSKEMDTWVSLQMQKAFTIYPREQSFWEKYAPYIILAMLGGLMIVMLIIFLKEASGIYGGLASITSQLKGISDSLAGNVFPPGT